MSQIKVDQITDEAGTGAPDFPNGLQVAGASLSGVADQSTAEAGLDNEALMTSLRTKEAIAAQGSPLLGSWVYAGVTSTGLGFTDLGDWDQIEVVFEDLTSSADPHAQVSFDNGASWQTSGYASTVHNDVNGATSTTQILLNRVAVGSNAGRMTLSGMKGSNKAVSDSAIRLSGASARMGNGAATCPSGDVNAIRILGGNLTGGAVYVYGTRR